MTCTISCWSEDTPACCCGHVHIQAGTADSEPSKFPMNKHKCFMLPSPEHLARLGGWESEGNRIMLLLGSVFPAPLPVCCGKPLAAKQGRITCGPSREIQQKLKRALPKDLPGPGTSVPCGTIHRGSDFVATKKAMCKHGTRENTPQKKKHFCAVIFSNAGSHNFVQLFFGVCLF